MKKKSPTDLTLRNLRAAVKRHEKLIAKHAVLEARVKKLEDWLKGLY